MHKQISRMSSEVFASLQHNEVMSLCLTKSYIMNMYPLLKHHTTKMYGWVEVQIHAVLTSALGGGEWSISHPGHFALVKMPPVPTGDEVRRAPESV